MKRIATAASNEWNVPDWRDESQYPIPLPESDDSDLISWRWKFLRRDKEYRQDWLRIRAKDPEERLALLKDPEEWESLYNAASAHLQANPSLGLPPWAAPW